MADREKLIELMKESYCSVMGGYGDEEKTKWLLGLDIEINWEDIADHLISNGVIIQKQGEWVCTDIFPWGDVYRCLECGCDVDVTQLTNYCPDCGAKMKEV